MTTRRAIKRPKYAPEHTMQQLLAGEQAVIDLLYRHGFIDHGIVNHYTVFTESGIAIELGGRKRYILPGTDQRATVGRIITLFYRVAGDQAIFVSKTKTINFNAVQTHLGLFLLDKLA